MKKYVLLRWDNYYPSGALGNVFDSFDTLEAAIEYEDSYEYDWHAIADRDTWHILERWQPESKVYC